MERRVWVGHEKWLPGLPFLSQLWALPDASLTFTVTFSRGSGGTSDWQGPPPSACQHSVASAGSEHGASSRQPSGCSSCSRVARQRLRYARGSVGRGRGHCSPLTLPPAPLPPWPLWVCSPFLKGQMLVLTESSSRGHTWKGNRALQVKLVQPTQPGACVRPSTRHSFIH